MNQWKLINHTFKFREGDTDEKGGCTFIGGSWKDVTTDDLFKDRKVVMFSLPGAFTPTCSSKQLPGYETKYKVPFFSSPIYSNNDSNNNWIGHSELLNC